MKLKPTDPLKKLLEFIPNTFTEGPRAGRSRGIRSRCYDAVRNCLYTRIGNREPTIADLQTVTRREMLCARNCGGTSLMELEYAMKAHGLRFKDAELTGLLPEQRRLVFEALYAASAYLEERSDGVDVAEKVGVALALFGPR